jgi:drug/metabolite transporter (DMT)-like permease
MQHLRVWLAFALLSLIWGSSYLFIRIADQQISALAVVALRLFFGAAAITLIALVLRAELRVPRRALVTLVALSVVNTTAPFLLITWGEKTIDSGLAAVLNSTTPIFSLFIAHLALRDERITPARIAGVIVGFAGVVLLLSRDLSASGIHWSGAVSQGAVILASACYALAAVSARRWLKGVHSMTISTYTLWFAGTEAVILSLIFSPPPLASLHPKTLLAVVWLGVLGSAVAYLLYYFIIMTWGASRATLVTYVVPAIGLVLGAIFLGEVVDWRILGGSVLVILGVGLAGLMGTRPRPSREEEALSAEQVEATP